MKNLYTKQDLKNKNELTYWQMWLEVFKLFTFKRTIIIWIIFNFIALISSYAEFENFNNIGSHNTNNVWPFVKFYESKCKFIESYESIERGRVYNERLEEINKLNSAWGQPIQTPESRELEGVWNSCFYGVFVDYDWSEFSLFALLPLILLLLNKYIPIKLK